MAYFSEKADLELSDDNSDTSVENMLSQYFQNKIESIKGTFSDSHATASPKTTHVIFTCFSEVSVDYS